MGPVLAQQNALLTRAQVYKLLNNVQLLIKQQPPRPAKKSDPLSPQDELQTKARSMAELLFNEGSLTRIDQNSRFRFLPGMRRFQLRNRIAMTETIFQLNEGAALAMIPPGSVGTTLETPDSKIEILSPSSSATSHLPSPSRGSSVLVAMHGSLENIAKIVLADRNFTKAAQEDRGAVTAAEDANLLSPPDRASALMVIHDPASNKTQVFALTNGSIKVSNLQGINTVPLQGGETVSIISGNVGEVKEFDLEAFYKTNKLAAGLGPGQENIVAQESIEVQQTLNTVRAQTIPALRDQQRRIRGSGFRDTFLSDALSGGDSGFDGQKGESSFVFLNDRTIAGGTFTRTSRNTAIFTDDDGSVTNISVDFQEGTITINNNTGKTSTIGLSGNNVAGTVIGTLGEATRIEVFDVGGKEPSIGSSFRGTLTTGIAPDR
jgi:hypothetical protein